MPVIDADAHVMEGPQTWEYCDPSERQYMPIENTFALDDINKAFEQAEWQGRSGRATEIVRAVIKP
jgi:hypothetical protein